MGRLCTETVKGLQGYSVGRNRADAYVSIYDILNEFLSQGRLDLYVTGSNSKLLLSG